MSTLGALVITDTYSVVVIDVNEEYIPWHELSAISIYASTRGELPGAQILCPNHYSGPDDIVHKSVVPDKSMWVAEIYALAKTQMDAGVEDRTTLSRWFSKKLLESGVTCMVGSGVEMHISEGHYDNLLRSEYLTCYSGVLDDSKEPTAAWKSLPSEAKGVYFQYDETFYGLVMPHAKTDVGRSKS